MIKFIWSKLLDCFVAKHNPTIRADKNGNVFGGGGGGTTVYQPTPEPAPSTAEAIEAYIAGLPAMYQAQMEWGPKITEQQIGQTMQYMPEVLGMTQALQQYYAPQQVAQQVGMQMQYAPQLAEQQQALQRMYEPEAYQAKGVLGGMMTPGYLGSAPYMQAQSPQLSALGGMYSPQYMGGYNYQQSPAYQDVLSGMRQDIRGAWANRGLAESGMSAYDEAATLAEFEFPYAMQMEQMNLAEQARRQQMGMALGQAETGLQESAMNRMMSELGRRQNLGLSMAGRYNVPTQATVGYPNVTMPNVQGYDVMQGYNFPQVQNSMMQGYGTYTQAAQPYVGYQQSPWGQIGGGLLQGAGSIAAAKIMVACFAEDTLISTEQGIKHISDIEKDEYILTNDGFKKVKRVFKYNKTPTLSINHVETTEYHPFVMKNGELKYAKDLKKGDVLYNGYIVDHLEKIKSTKNIYNLEVDGHRFYVNGILVHDGREVK